MSTLDPVPVGDMEVVLGNTVTKEQGSLKGPVKDRGGSSTVLLHKQVKTVKRLWDTTSSPQHKPRQHGRVYLQTACFARPRHARPLAAPAPHLHSGLICM